jgi:hypothetical protein
MVTTTSLLALVVVLATLGCSLASDRATAGRDSRVSVTFVEPERFTDVKDSVLGSDSGRAGLLAELEGFLRAAGARQVPAGLSLTIHVTDVDLAGEFEPGRGPQFDRVRIMREIYPPRIDLEFRLTDSQGTVVREGRRQLRDHLYLTRAALGDSDRLRYETDLLGDWLRQELGVRS